MNMSPSFVRRHVMAQNVRGLVSVAAVIAAVAGAASLPSQAQSPQAPDPKNVAAAQPHRAAAKAAAGDRFTGVYTATCGADGAPAATAAAAPAQPRRAGPPDRSEWYAAPQ